MSGKKQTCFPNVHMRPEEYALWDLSRKLAHQTGVLYFDGREMAKRFRDTAKDRIYRAARSLVEAGWFEVIAPAARDGRTGLYSCTQYHVLSSEEWAKNHPHVCVTIPASSPEAETGTGPQNATGGIQSSKCDRHQSLKRERPVPEMRMTSPYNATYSDKENLDKEIVRGSETATPALPVEDSKPEGKSPVDVQNLWKLTNRSFQAAERRATIYGKYVNQITKQIAGSDWTEDELMAAATEIAGNLHDEFECKQAGSILAAKLDATIARMRDEKRKPIEEGNRTRQLEKAVRDAIALRDRESFDKAEDEYRRHMSTLGEMPFLFVFERRIDRAVAATV